MKAPPIFNRVATLNLNGIGVTDLRMTFKIEKDLTVKPNKIELQVYNLSADSRRKLTAGTHALPVSFSAGYKDIGAEQLFIGDVARISHVRSGPDWISKFEAGDGEDACARSHLSWSKKAATMNEAVQKVVGSLTTGIGNAVTSAVKGAFRQGQTEMGDVAMHGKSIDLIQGMMDDAGLEHSIQDGQQQVMPKGAYVGTTAVVLSPTTGLVGSPEMGVSGKGDDAISIVKARALIQPRLTPGWRIKLESASQTGFMRIEKVSFSGDTHGNDWYADLELTPTQEQ